MDRKFNTIITNYFGTFFNSIYKKLCLKSFLFPALIPFQDPTIPTGEKMLKERIKYLHATFLFLSSVSKLKSRHDNLENIMTLK